MNTRRHFLKLTGGLLICAATGAWSVSAPGNSKPLNVLLFTADDLHCESVGCFGGEPEGMTPNLDRFAEEGMRFFRAHVNAAICAPSRAILATGLYGHNSGAMGFMPARNDVPNIIELFKNAGYMAGILGKVGHSTPNQRAKWDYSFEQKDLGDGRNPDIYYQRCRDFFAKCKTAKKPFYFMVNSHDPHRPFQVPGRLSLGSEEPSRIYTPEQAVIPGFLPDLPDIRQEISYYQNSARRLDDTFGRTMQALKESGYEENTLVMFLSDNGIAVPFAKCNVYLASTLTRWIVRWPEKVKPNTADRTHFISGIDFLPTILEATGVKGPEKLDGVSFVPLLNGKSQAGRDMVFTQIDSKYGGASVPMRCVQDGKYGYIFNAWSDGSYWYRNNNEGMSMRAMNATAKTDEKIAERVRMFRYRVLEELYDMEKDPDCLVNLIDNPIHKKALDRLWFEVERWMKRTSDPLLPIFKKRYDETARKAALEAVYGPPKNENPKRTGKRKKQ
jgi:N-sulfoglucosamine sulfohydrolase